MLKDGGKTLDELFDTMCLKLGIYLQEIGIIPKELAHIDLAKVSSVFLICKIFPVIIILFYFYNLDGLQLLSTSRFALLRYGCS